MRVITFGSILLLVPSAHVAEIRIPKTTVLTLALDQELEGKKVKKGKEFKAHLSEPVTGAGGQVIIPVGSEVKGRIEDADERHLMLKFKQIKTPSGKKSIEARLVGVDAENVKVEANELESPGKSGKKKVASVGTTATGMATGGIAGSAVKSIGRIFFGGGGEGLKLKKGTRLRIELRKELKLKLKEDRVSYWKAHTKRADSFKQAPAAGLMCCGNREVEQQSGRAVRVIRKGEFATASGNSCLASHG
jgi:hypothetical protein